MFFALGLAGLGAHAEENVRLPVLSALASAGTFDGIAIGATLRGANASVLASVALNPQLVVYQYKNEAFWAFPSFLLQISSTFTLGGSFVVVRTPKHTDSVMFGGRWHGLLGPGLWLGVQRRSQISKRVGFLIYGGGTILPSASEGLRNVLEPGSRVLPLGTYVGFGGNFGLEYALF